MIPGPLDPAVLSLARDAGAEMLAEVRAGGLVTFVAFGRAPSAREAVDFLYSQPPPREGEACLVLWHVVRPPLEVIQGGAP